MQSFPPLQTTFLAHGNPLSSGIGQLCFRGEAAPPTNHLLTVTPYRHLAYDAPLLAVADGTVAAVVSDNKDATPQVITPDQAFKELGGNYVDIDIGNGNFAFYAHMLPGSASVKVGDKITRGQVIGRLGNSGNTTEAHLHFHVSRAPVPLSSDNVPFEIDRFTFAGRLEGEHFVPETKPSERTNQLPLAWDVIDFPPGP